MKTVVNNIRHNISNIYIYIKCNISNTSSKFSMKQLLYIDTHGCPPQQALTNAGYQAYPAHFAHTRSAGLIFMTVSSTITFSSFPRKKICITSLI